MPETYTLPNGTRVEIPDSWSLDRLQQEYSAGHFGPVAGNKLDPNAGYIPVANALRAAGHPGNVLVDTAQKGLDIPGVGKIPGTGQPESGPARLGAWIAREGLNSAPYALAGGGATALAGGRPVVGALARILANAGVAGATNPEDPWTHAALAGGTAGAMEAAAPLVAAGGRKLAEKAGMVKPASVLAQETKDAAEASAAAAAKEQARQRADDIAQQVGQTIEQRVPALSSSGLHPNIPSLAAARQTARPVETAQDLYALVRGGRGKEMLDQVGDAVRQDVGKKITGVSGQQYKLIIQNPQTGKPEALSFDEAWAARSAAGARSGSAPGVGGHNWGLTKDQWDREITASLNRINPNGEASATYQAGIDVLRRAYALRKVLAGGFTGKGGNVIDPARLQARLNDLGGFSQGGTAPNTTVRNLGAPLHARLNQILQHRAGEPVLPPTRPDPADFMPPRRPLVSPTMQTAVDAIAATPSGQDVASMRLPGLIERLERFFGLGGRRRMDPRSYEGWR